MESHYTVSALTSKVPHLSPYRSKHPRFCPYSWPQPTELALASTISPAKVLIIKLPGTSSLNPSSTRGKGKSKLNFSNDDDILLALLKKSRYESFESIGSLSNLEMVALSFMELQDSPPLRGPIQAFMASLLYGNHGQK